MQLQFYGKEFDKYERFKCKPYIGFFSPKGQLVDYNTELGGSHGDLGNLVSWTFLLWIKQKNIINDLNLKGIDTLAKLNVNNGVITNADIACNSFNVKSNLLTLQRDLLHLLNEAEDSESFRECINKKVDVDLFPKSIVRDRKVELSGESIYEIANVFGTKNTKSLLLLLKDICIQYLGYDSIERYKPNNEPIKLPELYYLYPDDYLTYFDKPRIIMTTHSNIYERFYSYLLMEWQVRKVPKYVYNSDTKTFDIDTTYFKTDKEVALEKEIETIKKHVPLREREKYFEL